MRLKLVSPKDTLLGVVELPDHWADWFKRSGAASAALMPKLRYSYPLEAAADFVMPEIQQVTIACAGWSQYPGAVCLVRGSIEELETLPGCSFSPSAAYLRSLVD